jgi:hypothetical protein
MFLSMVGAMGEKPEGLAWCQRFWRANRTLFDCLRDTPEPPVPTDQEKIGTAQARSRLGRSLWRHRQSTRTFGTTIATTC